MRFGSKTSYHLVNIGPEIFSKLYSANKAFGAFLAYAKLWVSQNQVTIDPSNKIPVSSMMIAREVGNKRAWLYATRGIDMNYRQKIWNIWKAQW